MRARLLRLLCLLAVAAAPPALAEGPGFQVVVNASNPAASVSRRQLSDMFLKKLTHWPDGTTVEPVEPPERSLTRAYFLSDVMGGKSALALKTFWQKRVFSGRDTPPVEKGSDEEVVAFVKANPGAIGYVSAAAAVGGVKVLEVKD
ncbi:MAG TPA: substrate-binding domain-containing protein [Anaeromyxobacter sp.]